MTDRETYIMAFKGFLRHHGYTGKNDQEWLVKCATQHANSIATADKHRGLVAGIAQP